MTYTCEKCLFSTYKKTSYDRHCKTQKHKLKIVPELAKQLANIKMEELELKTEMKKKESKEKQEAKQIELELKEDLKREELEKLEALKKKEYELREQIKEELTKEDKRISFSIIKQQKTGIDAFKLNVIERPELEDYCEIMNGLSTFEELFLRDWLAEYESHKTLVLEKDTNMAYYINNAPCMWLFSKDDRFGNGLTSMFELIPYYHRVLKQYAKDNGCKVEDFTLTDEVIKRIQARMIEEMTYIISLP